LWLVNYSSLQDFVDRSIGVGANAVAIRTDNDLLTAIPAFHRNAIKVYGWRWLSAQRDAAMSEADRVANLLSKGSMDISLIPKALLENRTIGTSKGLTNWPRTSARE